MRLEIEPAKDGGYVVKEVGSMNCMWTILYAGGLAACLRYIERRYTEE